MLKLMSVILSIVWLVALYCLLWNVLPFGLNLMLWAIALLASCLVLDYADRVEDFTEIHIETLEYKLSKVHEAQNEKLQ